MQKEKGISTLTGIIIIVVTAVVLFGGVFVWQYFVTQKAINQPQIQSQTNQTAGWQGTFSMDGYDQKAVLEKVDSSSVKLTVTGPDVRPNEPACSFTGIGTIVSNFLTINLDNSQYEQKDAKIIAKLSSDKKQLTIDANSSDNKIALMRFCYGGGSIGGTYIRK